MAVHRSLAVLVLLARLVVLALALAFAFVAEQTRLAVLWLAAHLVFLGFPPTGGGITHRADSAFGEALTGQTVKLWVWQIQLFSLVYLSCD